MVRFFGRIVPNYFFSPPSSFSIQVFVVLLKLCFFFGTGFSVAYLILIADRDDWGFGVTIAAIPLAIASLVLAAIAVRKEIKYLMIFSIVLFLAGLTYFAYKLSVMYNPSSEENYVHVKLTLTWFSIFSIVSIHFITRALLDKDFWIS